MQETDRACAPSTDPDYVCTLDLADGITFHYAVDATNLYGKMDVSGSACYDSSVRAEPNKLASLCATTHASHRICARLAASNH
eukprot:10295-Heterococcus_DN1.PRE.1